MIKVTELIGSANSRIEDFRRLRELGLICLNGEFFPSVHYPPITMYPPISEDELFKDYRVPDDGLFVVYAHIPFCLKQCVFCHYPVKIGELPEEKERYLNMLEREMDIYINRLGLKVIRARSILVGGGTPTYLTPAQLERFLRFFTNRVDLSHCTQFSYDVDPTTLLGTEGSERLRIMKQYGVNRLTIGLQSLDDNILKKMNRYHTAEEAIESVEQSRKAGFKVNIEFIYGYPGQSLESWIDTVEQATTLGVEEIQLYRLKIIPYGDHTGFIVNEFSETSEEFLSIEQALMMKQVAILILERKGYKENLRRVFTRNPDDFSHYADDQCCKLANQVGFGLTAFHSLRDRFGLNTLDFQKYYSLIENGRLPLDRGLIRTEDDQVRWCIILPLKNRRVYKKFYQLQTGVSLESVFRRKIERLKKFGLLSEDDTGLGLTALGAFFADEVCHQFHHPNYMPFPRTAYSQGELNPYHDCQP